MDNVSVSVWLKHGLDILYLLLTAQSLLEINRQRTPVSHHFYNSPLFTTTSTRHPRLLGGTQCQSNNRLSAVKPRLYRSALPEL